MARKKQTEVFREIIEEAVAAPTETARRKVISRAAKHKFVAAKAKRSTSKPSPYTERMGIEICERIARGEVLPEIVRDLHISINTVYAWIQNDTNGFRERYKTARLQMAETLVDNLLLETRTIAKDEALAAKVRASIVQWYSSKVDLFLNNFLIFSHIFQYLEICYHLLLKILIFCQGVRIDFFGSAPLSGLRVQ